MSMPNTFIIKVAKMDGMIYPLISLLILCCMSLVTSINVTSCQGALGMGNGTITDTQLSASSDKKNVGRARIYGDRAWRARGDSDEWIQVNLLQPVIVSGIATQGRPDGEKDEYVMKYEVEYSLDNDDWEDVEDDDNDDKVFNGNFNRNTTVYNMLPKPIRLRYFRIEATKCKERCALRFELYGCEAPPVTMSTFETGDSASLAGIIAGSIVGVLVIVITSILILTLGLLYFWRKRRLNAANKQGAQCDLPIAFEYTSNVQSAEDIHERTGAAYFERQNVSNMSNDYVYTYAHGDKCAHQDNTILSTGNGQGLREQTKAVPENGSEGWVANSAYATTERYDEKNTTDDRLEGWKDNEIYGEEGNRLI